MAIPYKIRRAELRDVEELVRMRVELLHVAPALGAPMDLTDAEWEEVADAVRRHFLDTLPTGKHCGVVAEAKGKIVACGGIIFTERPPYQGNLTGREAYLMNMYTVPEWRGKGAGGAIVAALLTHARETGAGRVSLDAEEKARHMYEKAGFHGNAEAMEVVF